MPDNSPATTKTQREVYSISRLNREARALLAERLASLSPGDINRVIFGVSGGEAIDMAIDLTRH